jgi:hypothetical protein
MEVLHHSLQHGGKNCCYFVRDVLFQVHCCPWFLFVHLALEISPEGEVLRLGTLIPMNIEVRQNINWVTTESFFKIISTAKTRCSTDHPMLYRSALHGNWNAFSLARRALKDKFPTPTVPLAAVVQNRQVFLPDPVRSYYVLGCVVGCIRVEPWLHLE